MKPSQFLSIVRASGWYDLIVTWLFATPWTFVWVYGSLAAVAQSLGLPGTMHTLDASHILFANLLGSVVVVWSLARLLKPSIQLGRLDAAARFLFVAWQINAVLSGVNAIVLAFTLFEVIFGVLQLWPVQQPTASLHPDEARNH